MAAVLTPVKEQRELPIWPLQAFFVGFPLWWVAGLGPFAAAILSVPMVSALVRTKHVRVPKGFGLWLLMLLAMVLATSQLDSVPRMVGAGFRLMTYVSSTVVYVYAYNASKQAIPLGRALGLTVVFWLWIVLGGYLGLLFPDTSISTPMEKVMPGSIASNELVNALIHPKFAEVQQPWGAPEPFVRPSAPFPYTNAWGSHFALLLPLLMLYLKTAATPRQRVLLILIALASLVPAFATLNRGMFLAAGAGFVYAALRFAQRGHLRGLAAVLGVIGVSTAAAYITGVADVINARLEVSGTNDDRMRIYLEAFTRTLESPLLGYGAPRPSEELGISVGTQGQFWNIMFSFGFPALILYVAFLGGLAWRTRSLPLPEVWLHVVPVMAVFMMFFYGLDGTQLLIILLASALAQRELTDREALP